MDRIFFKINGNKYSVGGEFPVDTTLTEYIRRHAGLPGTKFMCLEGGCGACVVNVRAFNPTTHEVSCFSVNSCLVSILSCDGWEITTIEGIGNRSVGYNIIQKRLNHYFGSQCGYCSPGFVMSMYSLIENRGHHLTEAEVEKSLGSNLCRCTGYRPILEAFKSLTKTPSDNILSKIKDIEDINEYVCPKSGNKCGVSCEQNEDWCFLDVNDKPKLKKIRLVDGRFWYAVNNLNSIFNALEENGYDSYMLVAGNTGKGVQPITFYPKLLIDISNVRELTTYNLDVNLILGGNITLTDTMKIFDQLSKSNEDFWYLEILYRHLEEVAHIPVRNIGTLAGNLMVKYQNPEFQSDIFLLFECVGAFITIVDRNFREIQIKVADLLTTNMKGRIITQIKLPPLSKNYKIVTYKVTPRAQNAHAEVNAAFLLKFDPGDHHVTKASLVYGGINAKFTHAFKTEQFLIGKSIFNNKTLQKALLCLNAEIHADFNPPEPSPYFREKLALSLFYKCIIKLCPRDILNPLYESGDTTAEEDHPPISRSYQEYDTNQADYPITQPLLKKEGMIQCAGEAVYSEDLPKIKDEVFASLVLSTVTKGDIESIDGSEALNYDGVLAVFTSADIPGINSIVKSNFRLLYENEEFLASDKVVYYNQPVAIVVAKTQVLADQMTSLVKIIYKNVSNMPAVVTIEDAIKAPKEENRLIAFPGLVPTDRGANIQRVIKGKFIAPQQYHHMMKLHNHVVVPVDDVLEIYSSTQWIDLVQATVGQLLKIPEHSVRVKTRRCGGGFGCKIARGNFALCAATLAAKLLNRPCRIAMNLRDVMRATGKRPDCRIDYEVGVDNRGEIQYMDGVVYVNDGNSINENQNTYSTSSFENCYDSRRWKIDSFAVLTDTPVNTFMRAPGGMEGISGIEHIMEHIAEELNLDPIDVRMANYRRDDNDLPVLVPMFTEKINYRNRQTEVKDFNKLNRWKKRGLKLSNMAFPTAYLGNYGALVSVYHGDGSVIVNVCGVEIGQGIFTRVAQAAANELRIPVDKVAVQPCTNIATPNNFSTASSITSQCCMYSVIRCCDQINVRLAPVRATMPQATWEQVVDEADRRGILLQANYLSSEFDPRMINYSIFGVAATEVEIDVLTGTKRLIRSDVLVDGGRSVNPAIDIGQVEGAFVQGLSMWMMEDVKYNGKTGKIYTDRTWNYKIMGARDIPHDFRSYLRRNSPSNVGILGSKAVGEPPITLSHVVVNSLRDAIKASRKDSGYENKFFDISVPVTNENVMRAAEVKLDEYLITGYSDNEILPEYRPKID